MTPAYADGYSALSDPTRRTIFERLAGGPRSVGELAAELLDQEFEPDPDPSTATAAGAAG